MLPDTASLIWFAAQTVAKDFTAFTNSAGVGFVAQQKVPHQWYNHALGVLKVLEHEEMAMCH